jgi:hypothetical protein
MATYVTSKGSAMDEKPRTVLYVTPLEDGSGSYYILCITVDTLYIKLAILYTVSCISLKRANIMEAIGQVLKCAGRAASNGILQSKVAYSMYLKTVSTYELVQQYNESNHGQGRIWKMKNKNGITK